MNMKKNAFIISALCLIISLIAGIVISLKNETWTPALVGIIIAGIAFIVASRTHTYAR